MLFDHIPDGLNFHDEAIVHEHVSIKVAEQRAVFVEHFQRMLLLHQQTLFRKTVNECVLINLLQMSVPMVAVDGKSRFANHIAKLHEVLYRISSVLLVPSVPFRGQFIGQYPCRLFFDFSHKEAHKAQKLKGPAALVEDVFL